MANDASRVSSIPHIVLWYLWLLPLFLAIRELPTFHGLTARPAAASSTSWTAYVALCIAALVVFVFLRWGRHRRVVFALFVVTLCAINLSPIDEPGFERIAWFVLFSIVAGVLLETVRQNTPLYRELKASKQKVSRVLGKAFLLWLPALLFIGIGLWGNYWLEETVKEAVYKSGLVDEYCAVEGDPDGRPIPCTGMEGRLEVDRVEKLKPEENTRRYITEAFLRRKKALLAELDNDEIGWSNKGRVLEELARVAPQLQPIQGRTIESGPAPPVEDYSGDPQVRALNEQHRVIDARLAGISSRGVNFFDGAISGMLRQRSQVIKLQKEKVQLLRGIELRNAALKQQAKDSDPDYNLKLKRQALNSELAKVSFDPKALRQQLAALIDKKARPDEVHATMKVAVVRTMNGFEDQVQEIANRFKDVQGIEAPRLCRLQGGEDADDDRGVFICPSVKDDSSVLTLEPFSFRDSAEQSIQRWHELAEFELERDLKKAGLASFERADQIKSGARTLVNRIPARIHLKRKSCGALNAFCHAGNLARGMAEGSYRDVRTSLANDFLSATDRRINKGTLSINEQIDQVRTGLYSNLEEVRKDIESSLDWMVKAGSIVSFLLALWLILAIIKSYLYVVATEIFSVEENATIGLESESDIDGTYEASNNVEIPSDFKLAMLTVAPGINQGKKVVIPQPFTAVIPRAVLWKWYLYKGKQVENKEMRFAQESGTSGVNWSMKEGEEVVFRLRNLFGFSENVRLRTTISLRLSTMLLGRYVFHSAQCIAGSGPGRLILAIRGAVEDREHEVIQFPLERLVAWSKHTTFKVASERSISSVFVDGYTVRRVPHGNGRIGVVVVGAPSGRTRFLQPMVRFVRVFLMPF